MSSSRPGASTAKSDTNTQQQVPLCVDLDGSLVNTDTLVESALLLVKANPLYFFAMLVWLLSGKANLKEQIAARSPLDVALLPYNTRLIDWLREQRDSGRALVLVTAANHRIAQAINAHLQLFDGVMASSEIHNLGAGRKRDKLIEVYGRGGYDYLGNSDDDLAVWADCRNAIVVNASEKTARRASACAQVEATFPRAEKPLVALLKAMRPHQWSKNLLVFVSIVTAQNYTDSALLWATVLAFIAFCLCSSAVYLINDLLDLQSDRQHSQKRYRPFASGSAPLAMGLAAALLLLTASMCLAAMVGANFAVVLVMYFCATLGYSFYLKRIVLLDVVVLSIFYTLRIIAGASVADAMPSVWLVSFSLFIFTSLAMAKRYGELNASSQDPDARASGRGYHVGDLAIIAQLGAASGYISVLVLALYIDSPDVQELYSDQWLMWLLCPLLMYWVGRIWLVASRGLLRQDPVIFATRDRVSYLIFALGAMILWAAK